MKPDWVDPLDKDIICYPPLRAFVKSVFDNDIDIQLIPDVDDRATFMSDGGPAFRNMSGVFNLHHLLCKKHLYAHDHLGSSSDKYVFAFYKLCVRSHTFRIQRRSSNGEVSHLGQDDVDEQVCSVYTALFV